MSMQALVVSGMNSRERQLFENDLERLNKILPAETPIDDTISKDELIKRLTSGSASLIHFTGHRGAVGKSRCYRRKRMEEREKEGILHYMQRSKWALIVHL